MTEWQKLSEDQMDEFINFSCLLLNIKDYSGVDFADIYEKAISLSPQKTIHNKDYSTALKLHNEYLDGYRTKWSITFNEWLNLRLNPGKPGCA